MFQLYVFCSVVQYGTQLTCILDHICREWNFDLHWVVFPISRDEWLVSLLFSGSVCIFDLFVFRLIGLNKRHHWLEDWIENSDWNFVDERERGATNNLQVVTCWMDGTMLQSYAFSLTLVWSVVYQMTANISPRAHEHLVRSIEYQLRYELANSGLLSFMICGMKIVCVVPKQ